MRKAQIILKDAAADQLLSAACWTGDDDDGDDNDDDSDDDLRNLHSDLYWFLFPLMQELIWLEQVK